MSQISTLIWKEWRTAVDTPLGYVIAVAFLLTTGFFFGNSLFLMGQAEMRGFFSIFPVLLIFFIPAMAMRSLAEEKRSGTFELLATLPVSTMQIVMGKYLAVLLQVVVLLGFTLVYPLTLATLGNIDAGQIAASYMAAFLLAAFYTSVCIFASSLTRNAVVAYVLGLSLLLAVFLLAQAAPLFSPFVQNVLEIVSPLSHYQSMLRGVVHPGDVVFLLALCVVFLAAAHFQLERRRWM